MPIRSRKPTKNSKKPISNQKRLIRKSRKSLLISAKKPARPNGNVNPRLASENDDRYPSLRRPRFAGRPLASSSEAAEGHRMKHTVSEVTFGNGLKGLMVHIPD